MLPNRRTKEKNVVWWRFVFNVSEFSPFALTYEVPAEKSGSSSQGSSTWLTEPVAAEQPTAQPTQAKTPAPVAGILAGLGAAAALFGLRRK